MYAQYGLLIARLCYLACLLPQIWLTQKTRSGKALSELFLFGYLNGYVTYLFYIFSWNLPLAYKIITPLETLAVFILIGQHLYHDRATNHKLLHWLYLANILILVAFIPWAMQNPLQCGNIFGWLTFVLSAINQLPQVVKIFYEKSVRGFSFMFVLFGGIGAISELISSIALSLPIQTIINALRGFIIFLVFCLQFIWYRK